MRQHQKFKDNGLWGETEAFGEAVDSYVASLLPGFDSDLKFSKGQSSPRFGDLCKGNWAKCSDFPRAKKFMKHGAKVRVFSIIGGRYAELRIQHELQTIQPDNCISAMVEDHTRFMLRWMQTNPNR